MIKTKLQNKFTLCRKIHPSYTADTILKMLKHEERVKELDSKINWDWDGKGSLEVESFLIEIETEYDDHISFGFDDGMGSFGNKNAPNAVKVSSHYIDQKYYYPALVEQGFEDYRSYFKKGKNEIYRQWLRAIEAEYDEACSIAEFGYRFISVKAYRTLNNKKIELGWSTIGGCTINSTEDILSIILEHEMIQDAVSEAKETLAQLSS